MQRNARAAVAVGILVAVACEGLGGGATALAQPAQDHLKCYQIKFPAGFEFTPVARDLDDEFGLERGCTILKPRELCVPATKVPSEPPAGMAVGHFVRYQLRCLRFASQSVAVRDQFLQQTVTVQKPVALLVPAEDLVTALQGGRFEGRTVRLTASGAKRLLGWALGPREAEAQGGLRDHLKCYRIKLPAGFRFTPMNRALDGEFGRENPVTFKKPKELCMPAEKTPGGPPQGPAAGPMVCYKGKFPAFAPRDVTVTDQFLSSQSVTVVKPKRACTPGELAPTTTTTSTTTATLIITTSTTASTTTTTQTNRRCGDGIIGPGEACDPPGSTGGGCPVGVCTQNCAACCGDGIVGPGEVCEPPGEQDLEHCPPDALFCNAQCTGCQSTPPETCGSPPMCTDLCGIGTCVLRCVPCGGGVCCNCLCIAQ